MMVVQWNLAFQSFNNFVENEYGPLRDQIEFIDSRDKGSTYDIYFVSNKSKLKPDYLATKENYSWKFWGLYPVQFSLEGKWEKFNEKY